MYKLILKMFLVISVSFFSVCSYAEFAVIVNPSNNASISQVDLERLFLAKVKTFSDGTLAIPLNHEEGAAIRVKFDNDIVGKSESQMKSYWAKLVFTGKAVPIKQMGSDQEVMELVAKNPSTVGYVKAASVDDTVKVILEF